MSVVRHIAVAHTVRDIFEQSALRGERILALTRAMFCLAIGARFYALTAAWPLPQAPARSVVTYAALAVGLAVSVATYSPVWRRRVPLWLHVSVAVDALVCCAALLPNAVWPGPNYHGVTSTGDATILMIVVMTAGLRHSPSAAILGAVLNSASYAVLVWADAHFAGISPWVSDARYVLCGIYLIGAASVAIVLAVASRRLALRAARAAVDADIAGRSLGDLLHGHHDVRAVLGAARLHADLLARELGRGASPDVVASTTEAVRADLGALEALVDQIKVRAYEEVLALERPVEVEVREVFDELVALLGGRYPAVAISAHSDGHPRARVVGGEAGLRRALFNLVVNACEGDGERGARSVALAASSGAAGVRIAVTDDGPGFPASALGPVDAVPSTKPSGTGLGLSVVGAIVRASAGVVTLHNGARGGGEVVIELPAG